MSDKETVTIATRIPMTDNHLIDLILQQSSSPWRTKSEYMRAALVKFGEDVATMTNDSEIYVFAMAVKEIELRNIEDMFMDRIAKGITDSARYIAQYLMPGDTTYAAERLDELCGQILKVPRRFWRLTMFNTFFDNKSLMESIGILQNGTGLGPNTIKLLGERSSDNAQ
jgi:hypothetical protein